MVSNTVCVTGASGFIGSHIVYELLKQQYHVRATVPDKNDRLSFEFLEYFPNADTHLTIYEADLLKQDSFCEPFHDCEGVFHVASPTFFQCNDPENELIKPARDGTINVLRCADKMRSVKRVIFTSDMVASTETPSVEGRGGIITEGLWSNENYLRENNKWYHLSKYLAEKSAWDFMQIAGARSFKLITVLPSLVIGPMLQPHLNFSNSFILNYLNGNRSIVSAKLAFITDVRDVAVTHIRLLESSQAQGRYICNGNNSSWKRVCDILRSIAPNTNIPEKIEHREEEKQEILNLSTHKLQEDIQIQFRTLEETLENTIQSFVEHNLLDPDRLRKHA